MTVETTSTIVTYLGDGVTDTFPFPFPVYDEDHLLVYYRDTTTKELTLVSASDYSVTGVGDQNGGNVVVDDPTDSDGLDVVITLQVGSTQTLDISNQGGFNPDVVEQNFDLVVEQNQRQDEVLDRTVRGQIGEEWAALPEAPVRAGGFLTFTDDDDATPTIAGVDAIAALMAQVLVDGSGISITYDPVNSTITITNEIGEQDAWLLETGSGGGGGSGDAEFIRDTMFASLIGSGVTITQDDPGDTITLTVTGSVSLEQVYDAIASAVTQGTGILIVDSDPGDTTTISADPEFIRDTIGTALIGGVGIDVAVSDGSDTITINSKPDIQSVVSAATVTPTFSDNQVNITAQAVALALANPTGTAVDGHGILIRVKDNGVSRAITYGTKYREFNDPLPSATTAGKTHYFGIVYNSADDKWDVLGVRELP